MSLLSSVYDFLSLYCNSFCIPHFIVMGIYGTPQFISLYRQEMNMDFFCNFLPVFTQTPKETDGVIPVWPADISISDQLDYKRYSDVKCDLLHKMGWNRLNQPDHDTLLPLIPETTLQLIFV